MERIPTEIHDHLLQYFDVKELVNVLSMVSRYWYQSIGSSSLVMKKIKINLRAKRKTDFAERIDTLQWLTTKGARKYQHLQINCLYDEQISNGFWNFLKSSADSVETINIRSMKIEEPTKILLPHLKELKVMFVPRDAIDVLLTSSSKFKKLILWNEVPLSYDHLSYLPSEQTISSVKQFLEANKKLEELEIQGRAHYFSFFQSDISNIGKFQLKKLTVKMEMTQKHITEENEENLIKFLASQACSLESINLDVCGPNVIKFIFNCMPSLKTIHLDIDQKALNDFKLAELGLSVNEKITELEIPYVNVFDDIKSFVDMTPNVEILIIGHINPRILLYAGNNFMNLHSIIYRYDDGECEKSYESLKLENPEMNQHIALLINNDFN